MLINTFNYSTVKSENIIKLKHYMHDASNQVLWAGADPGGRSLQSPPLKPMKVTFLTMILYNSKKSIRDIGYSHFVVHCFVTTVL